MQVEDDARVRARPVRFRVHLPFARRLEVAGTDRSVEADVDELVRLELRDAVTARGDDERVAFG